MNQREREELQQVVREAVDCVFDRLGIDTTDKRRVESLREDLAFLRRQRRGATLIGDVTVKTCVGAAVMAFLWVVAEGARAYLNTKL